MAKPETKRAWLSWEIAAVICRWVLGGFFIYMGLNKALDPVAFLKLVRQYEMVTDPVLLNSIAAALPWFEVFCGLLLLLGVAVRGAALMLALMLAPFTVIVLRRALAIVAATGKPFHTIAFDCGCGAGEVIIWHKLIENSIFFLLACWLMSGHGRRFCARFTFFPEPLTGQSRRVGRVTPCAPVDHPSAPAARTE